MGLERGSLSLMGTMRSCLRKKNNSGSGLENRECGRGEPYWPRGTLYPQKLALTSPTSGCRSVGIVRSRTQATELWWIRGNQSLTTLCLLCEGPVRRTFRQYTILHMLLALLYSPALRAVRLLYEPGYVMPCAGNLSEGTSCVNTFEFPTVQCWNWLMMT
jgi:hypothetical protein